jgi:hypothetical protein
MCSESEQHTHTHTHTHTDNEMKENRHTSDFLYTIALYSFANRYDLPGDEAVLRCAADLKLRR